MRKENGKEIAVADATALSIKPPLCKGRGTACGGRVVKVI